MKEFVLAAAKLADVDAPNEVFNQYSSGRGGAPSVNIDGKKEDFADTEAGKDLATNMGLRI